MFTYFFREWRLHRGKRQKVVAAQAGVSISTIYDLESGRANFTREMLERIAPALDTTPGELLSVNPLKPAQAIADSIGAETTAEDLRLMASIINGLADLVDRHPERVRQVARAAARLNARPRNGDKVYS